MTGEEYAAAHDVMVELLIQAEEAAEDEDSLGMDPAYVYALGPERAAQVLIVTAATLAAALEVLARQEGGDTLTAIAKLAAQVHGL